MVLSRASVLGVALMLSAAPVSAADPAPQPLPHLATGTPAPDFTVERLVGGSLQLSSLRGRVVVIDFWATWCPPCRAELPWLLKLARSNEARGLFFIAMNQDEGAQRALAASFASELSGIDRFIALGGPVVGAPFHVDGLPTLYVIDRQGRVFASAEGRLTEAAVAGVIEQALAQP
jgi:thiol-disulfide isomerase/thioredoxin